MKKKSKKQERREIKQARLSKISNYMDGEINMETENNLVKVQRHTQSTLIEHYTEKYGKPKTDEDSIRQLCIIYRDLMNVVVLSKDVSDGIGEYYRVINHRGLPAFEWVLEAIHVTSKKSQEKRNFKYIVGMLRQWLKYGFGHIPNAEETEIMEYFEEIIGDNISIDARSVIENLMGTYGAIKVTRMIGSLETDGIDVSLVKANLLKDLMQLKYSKQ